MKENRPMYARILRLRRIRPSGVLCFLLFEGVIAAAALLALAELVSWWAVLVLPLAVAAMVKLNDAVAGRQVRDRRAPISARPASIAGPRGPSGGDGPSGQTPRAPSRPAAHFPDRRHSSRPAALPGAGAGAGEHLSGRGQRGRQADAHAG